MELIAALLAAAEYVDKYGPLVAKYPALRKSTKTLVEFIREHKEIDGITPTQRARFYEVLKLDPADL